MRNQPYDAARVACAAMFVQEYTDKALSLVVRHALSQVQGLYLGRKAADLAEEECSHLPVTSAQFEKAHEKAQEALNLLLGVTGAYWAAFKDSPSLRVPFAEGLKKLDPLLHDDMVHNVDTALEERDVDDVPLTIQSVGCA